MAGSATDGSGTADGSPVASERHPLDVLGLFDNDYDEDGFRTCSVTGLEIHRSAEHYAKLFGLTAVVALLVGGLFAITVPMTRWELVSLIDPNRYYVHLSMHAWNLLIFWMVFMEIAILYVGGPMVLGRRLPITSVAKAGWAIMTASALTVNYAIWTTSGANEAPLLTAYVPLPAEPLFYAGAIGFLLGATVAALPFFVAIWREKRGQPHKTLPLAAFAAFVTGIVAVEAILGGIAAFAYALAWRMEWIASADPALYRELYWIVGHGTQQINLIAMITVWYLLTHYVGGAEVVSEKVSRSAFVLYLFFINLGAAHHLLSDPVVSTGWRLFNTSYAFYGASFASMVHAFAIPAGLEAGRRKRGKGGGLFGWLTSAPWSNPVFSATVISIVLFGFMGGITGVVMGQLQLNMTWHNTFATVGHFHATVVLGTTIAFMGLLYFLLQTSFDRELAFPRLASLQPFLYGGTMGVVALMMMYMGLLYSVPRRTAQVITSIPGTEFSLSGAAPLMHVFGAFAVLAVLSGASFLVVALATLLVGDRNDVGAAARRLRPAGEPLPDGGVAGDASGVGSDPAAADSAGDAAAADSAGDAVATDATSDESVVDPNDEEDDPVHAYEMRGTFVLCLIFLGVFAAVWALNWYLLSGLWSIGA